MRKLSVSSLPTTPGWHVLRRLETRPGRELDQRAPPGPAFVGPGRSAPTGGRERMTEQMRARPLIGVSTSEVRRDPPETEHGEPERQEMVLGIRYLRAIEAAGGLPMVMPPLAEEAIDPLLDRLGGICLSGGPDLDPRAYGAAPHEELGPTEPTLDHFELALARRADERGLPVLAVCRGMQLLNVARGGTLHQHLPEVVGPRLTHRQSEPCGQPTHWVRLDADSALSRLMSRRRAKVNSFHHQ